MAKQARRLTEVFDIADALKAKHGGEGPAIFFLADEIDRLQAENERRGQLLEDVVNEVAYVEEYFYSANAAGTPQYLEPEPAEMVRKALSLKNDELKGLRYHGCLTGDCPHDDVNDCLTAIKEAVNQATKGGK